MHKKIEVVVYSITSGWKKEDLMFFWRNERYEAKAVTKCLRQ